MPIHPRWRDVTPEAPVYQLVRLERGYRVSGLSVPERELPRLAKAIARSGGTFLIAEGRRHTQPLLIDNE